MSQDSTLGQMIADAATRWLTKNGGGFPTAFVVAIDFVNSEGEARLFVSELAGQNTRTSLGLVAELEECYRAESRAAWDATLADDE